MISQGLCFSQADTLAITTPNFQTQNDTLNQSLDGRKQGYWIIWSEMRPDLGYPLGTRIEEGTYKADRKEGVWIKYHKDGVTPRLIGNYINGRPNGEYWKYYESGCTMEIGIYQYKIYEESTRYEDDCLDSLNGTVISNYKREQYTNEKVDTVLSDSSVVMNSVPMIVQDSLVHPNIEMGNPKGKKKEPNGYNKLYNKEDELVLDGEFENGFLKNGKYYKYDSDGILLKIEIWKNGKYHSDGQL